MWLLMTLPALADVAADTAAPRADDCALADVIASAPAAGATDVPVDAQLWLQLGGDCEGPYFEPLWATLSEVVDGAEVEVVSVRHDVVPFSGMINLLPVTQLSPDTEHRVRVEGDGTTTELSFTTGSGRVQGLGGAGPTATWLDYTFGSTGSDSGDFTFAAEGVPVSDPDGLSVIELTLDGVVVLRELVEGDRPVTVDLFQADAWYNTADGLERCLTAVQIDGAGHRSASDEQCREPDEVGRFGCQAAPVGGGLWGLAVLLLGLGRRRG